MKYERLVLPRIDGKMWEYEREGIKYKFSRDNSLAHLEFDSRGGAKVSIQDDCWVQVDDVWFVCPWGNMSNLPPKLKEALVSALSVLYEHHAYEMDVAAAKMINKEKDEVKARRERIERVLSAI